jgi:hypothetical protein
MRNLGSPEGYPIHFTHEQKVMPQEFTNTKVEQHHGKIFFNAAP